MENSERDFRITFLYSYHGSRFSREADRSIGSILDVHPEATIVIDCPDADRPAIAPSGWSSVHREAASGGYQYKVQGISRSALRKFIFLDTDTKILRNLDSFWNEVGKNPLVGIIDPLLDSFRHGMGLKRPSHWPTIDSPISEINTGVIGINKSLLPVDFFNRWHDRHLELCAANPEIPAASVPDQPSFRQAYLEAGVTPLLLGPEYNFRPYYPQTLYRSPLIVHAHPDSLVAFRDGIGEVDDIVVTLPWGGRWSRSYKIHRMLYLFYRAVRRMKSSVLK